LTNDFDIISEGSNRKGLVMQPESIDIPGIHASEIIENSRLFMSYFLRMLILAYLNISKIIKSFFSALWLFEWHKSFSHETKWFDLSIK
jgi:hypothetical protein